MESWREELYENELYHHGIKGQQWGIRRYQEEDGSLTEAGKTRYRDRNDPSAIRARVQNRAYKQAQAAAASSTSHAVPTTRPGESRFRYNSYTIPENGHTVNGSFTVHRTGENGIRYSLGRHNVDPKARVNGYNFGISKQTQKNFTPFQNHLNDSVGAGVAKIQAVNGQYAQQDYQRYLEQMAEANKSWAQRAFEDVSEKVEETWEEVSRFASDTASKAVDLASDAANAAVEAGKSLLNKIFGR